DAALNQQKIDLYHPQNKGGISKKNDIGTSINYGILKGYMPTPTDDAVRAESSFDYHKPSEQTTFQMQGKWPKLNFNLLVHPFSNGISSTVFNQL
ncbi:MAG TPA: hypothetical protein PLD88_05025, partial [Candidatus Berkiella sp.]|nr:hypothetical protein [Candidatus Berkiella sp.]